MSEALSTYPIHDRHVFREVDANEVYLVSFPRSGNTWVRCMVTTLLCGVQVTPELIQAVVPDVYVSHLTNTPKPRIRPLVIKTHAPYIDLSARVIYLVRDGREALKSYYIYAKNFPSPSLFDDFSTSADFFFRDDLWPCPWHKHVRGWLDGFDSWPDEQHTLIRYEDLLRDPEGFLRSIAQFIGIDASNNEIRRAVKMNSRDRLIRTEGVGGEGSLNYVQSQADDSGATLSAQDLSRYESIARDVLSSLGYVS